MCFHPDHWTWWVVRPSNLVDILPWQKWRKPSCFEQPGHAPKIFVEIAQSSGRLPYHFGTTVFGEHLQVAGSEFSTPPRFDFASLCLKILKLLPSPPPQKKKERIGERLPKASWFKWCMLVFWGGVWQLDEAKYKEATLQHVLDDLVSQVPFTATKPCWKPRNEVEVLDLKLKTIHKHQKKAELNKCWWSQTISTRGVLGCFVLPKVLPRWGLCQGESGYVGTTIR